MTADRWLKTLSRWLDRHPDLADTIGCSLLYLALAVLGVLMLAM